MEVILKKDIENLGLELDLVNVKPGYARNYLIPNGIALLATPKNKQDLQATLKEREKLEAEKIAAAKQIIEAIKGVDLVLKAKSGEAGRLFGSITNQDLAEALNAKSISIDKKFIKINGTSVKKLGTFKAKVRLHRLVESEFDFTVVAEN